MIRAVKIKGSDMKEILEALPEELRNKIMSAIKPDSGIDDIKEFVENYEDDNMLYHVVAHTLSNLLKKITTIACDMQKDRKKQKKPGVNTIELAMLCIECLKDEAKNIQKALDKHDEECDRGDDCGAKH